MKDKEATAKIPVDEKALDWLKSKFEKGELKGELAEVIWGHIYSASILLGEYASKPRESVVTDEPLEEKPVIVERFADNGAHSHWELRGELGVLLWTEDKEDEEWMRDLHPKSEGIKLQAQLEALQDLQREFMGKYGQGHHLLVGKMIKLNIKLEELNSPKT